MNLVGASTLAFLAWRGGDAGFLLLESVWAGRIALVSDQPQVQDQSERSLTGEGSHLSLNETSGEHALSGSAQACPRLFRLEETG